MAPRGNEARRLRQFFHCGHLLLCLGTHTMLTRERSTDTDNTWVATRSPSPGGDGEATLLVPPQEAMGKPLSVLIAAARRRWGSRRLCPSPEGDGEAVLCAKCSRLALHRLTAPTEHHIPAPGAHVHLQRTAMTGPARTLPLGNTQAGPPTRGTNSNCGIHFPVSGRGQRAVESSFWPTSFT